MDVERTLQRLQIAEVRHLPLSALKTNDDFQPRVGRLVPFREKAKVERRSDDHAATMKLALEASHTTQLEPVLVADVEGSLYVVDYGRTTGPSGRPSQPTCVQWIGKRP
jgi:hypothetical protein